MFNGFTMAFSFLILWAWVPAQWRRRIVGYGFFADISVHVILQSLFGGDGEGRIGMLFGGVLINMFLHGYRRFRGYELLSTSGWVRYR